MKIAEIYEKYKIPPLLQTHMFRVAAVGGLIYQNFTDQNILNKQAIIETLLLHDMGNIIKFKLDNPDNPLYKTIKDEVQYWRKIQKSLGKSIVMMSILGL